MSNDKKKDHKEHKHSSPAMKVGEGFREKAPSHKEKVEEPSSTEKEKREQPRPEKVHAELEAKAKDATFRLVTINFLT